MQTPSPRNAAATGVWQLGLQARKQQRQHLSHIHTLRVQAGHQGVLQVAGVTQELLGSGTLGQIWGKYGAKYASTTM